MAMYTPPKMPVDMLGAKLLALAHARSRLFMDPFDKYRAIEYLVRRVIHDPRCLYEDCWQTGCRTGGRWLPNGWLPYRCLTHGWQAASLLTDTPTWRQLGFAPLRCSTPGWAGCQPRSRAPSSAEMSTNFVGPTVQARNIKEAEFLSHETHL